MNQTSDREGFAVLYPEGTPDPTLKEGALLNWNHGQSKGLSNMRDSFFIFSAVRELMQFIPIDTKRIFVTGISAGAFMAYRLACEWQGIAALAPIAGTLTHRSCSVKRPLSLLAFHGTSDSSVPIEGGSCAGKQCQNLPPVEKGIDLFEQFNQCNPSHRQVRKGSAVEIRSNSSCQSGSEVALVKILGGGHSWPSSSSKNASHAVNANEMMKFFSKHSRQ